MIGGRWMTIQANLIFKNGQVITVDDQFTVCEALAVKDNKILATGTNDQMIKYEGIETEVIDLSGKSLLPGFIDAHAHLELYGTNKLGVNCKNINSIEEMKEKLGAVAEKTPIGQWIRGWGYNQNKLLEGRHPNRWDLDEVSTEHPIIVVRTCGHISAANSKALELGEIHKDTIDPVGGKFVRENGVPNGVLLEAAHMNMSLFAQYSKKEIMEGLKLASEDFMRYGITSVHDAGGYGTEHFRHLYEAVKNGLVKVRVYAMYGSLHDSPGVVRSGIQAGTATGLGDEQFRIGPAKVFIDGSSSGPTAATRLPYTSNPNDSGILYLNQEELNQILGEAHESGWQITAHAIGDKAVEMMINCIENALNNHPRDNPRHRIEHAAITPPDLVEKIKELGIIPVPNPAFIQEFGDGYIKDYGERVEHMFPIRSFLDANIIPAKGADSPITSFNPLIGIHAAVNRFSQSEKEVGASQTITIQEAIKLYTWNGAYASFEEKKKGSLEANKLADLVILDRSILNTPNHEIQDIEVEMTVIDGEIIYGKEVIKYG